MLCVKCGGQTHVTSTVADKDNVIRERECRQCGNRFVTIEIVSYEAVDRDVIRTRTKSYRISKNYIGNRKKS